MFDVKKILMFELILGKWQQDLDPVFKILICWIRSRIRPKMDRIRNPVKRHFQKNENNLVPVPVPTIPEINLLLP